MKVILLAPLPPPYGGIASWTLRMLDSKLKNEWQVDVVDEKLIGGREIFGDNSRINFKVELKRTFRIWKDLWRKLSCPDVKVVHSCIPAGLKGMLRELGCLLITRLKKRKFIIHYRCTIPNMVKDKATLVVFKLLTGLSDFAIVLNTPSKLFIQKHCKKTDTHIVPNFVEDRVINSIKKREISESIKVALYVGGVIASKGCLLIIEASKQFPDIEFRLVGKFSKEVEIEAAKSNNVILYGEKNKEFVQVQLQKADIFLFPSYFKGEGFSNSLVEAMVMGLPCIVSDWAANSDMIENKGGITIPIRDSNSLVEGINKLEDSELRKSMSSWNINKVKNYYNESKVTSRYVDIYEMVL